MFEVVGRKIKLFVNVRHLPEYEKLIPRMRFLLLNKTIPSYLRNKHSVQKLNYVAKYCHFKQTVYVIGDFM